MEQLTDITSRIIKIEASKKEKQMFQERINNLRNTYQEALLKLQIRRDKLIDKERTFLNSATKDIEKEVSECEHSLVLCLGKEYALDKGKPYCVCLGCNLSFRLGDDWYDELEVKEESIIDVSRSIPEEVLVTYKGDENILVTQAKRRLQELASENPYLPLEEVKKIILDDLVHNRPATRKREK